MAGGRAGQSGERKVADRSRFAAARGETFHVRSSASPCVGKQPAQFGVNTSQMARKATINTTHMTSTRTSGNVR